MSVHFQNDRILTHENGAQAIIQKSQVPELMNRKIYSFKRAILSEEDRHIIDSYDPMKENPFLVEYIFKK